MISVEKTVFLINLIGGNITEGELREIIRCEQIKTELADYEFQESTKYTYYILKDSLISYLKRCYDYNDRYLNSLLS
ncbi:MULTISPECIES: hypothetical protein [unclassified Lysinibacillus]|uniref:hypothetical protein n=1 Tax=unclassified Lysinibacillus TaxID=2636778 RepID=UPI00088C1C0B|nr:MULTISPECIES: hypothetical protein [unclassified Lysinibacillus]SCY87234.1 hypothetical protein SAMN02787078_02813 [Lysinibacillus sp. SG9]SDB38368.1 hypothetical protein SAMN02787079_02853 [Lysinibacillus sp. TC-37]SFT02393.1 hypothetical protein SAMN02787087_03108 [Lysinibacillus sp. SG55]